MLSLIAAVSTPEDRDLLTEFYEKNINLLFYEAQKHLSVKEDIEDAVYEAFKKLTEHLDVFRTLTPKQRARYAVVTVRNLCFLQFRRNGKEATVSIEDLQDIPSSEDTPEQIVEQQEFFDQVQSIMTSLPLETRMLLEQKYILRWSDETLATLYGIKTHRIRMKLSRARRELNSRIAQQNLRFPEFQ